MSTDNPRRSAERHPPAPRHQEPSASTAPSHSDDFSFVRMGGLEYRFVRHQQREAMRALWAEWEKGNFGLHQMTIGKLIGSSNVNYRLVHTFRETNGTMHQAWNTIIQPCGRGVYRLVEPGSTLQSQVNHDQRYS